jgi:protein required for attachment to host cells
LLATPLQQRFYMHRTCIAVVDASRARLLTYERSADPGGLTETFTEQRDFINPARRMTASELASDSPGSSRSGSLQFGFDDHRDAHIDKLDSEFSRMVNDEVARLLRETPAKRLIICASPRMLGHLRAARGSLDGSLAIDELPRDLVKLTPTQLRDHLASHGLLPPRPARGME